MRIIDLGLHYMDDQETQEEDSSTESDGGGELEPLKRLKNFILKFLFRNRTTNCYSRQKSISQSIRLHINAKEAKPVEVLLQRMFADEFDIEHEDLVCQDWRGEGWRGKKCSFIQYNTESQTIV